VVKGGSTDLLFTLFMREEGKGIRQVAPTSGREAEEEEKPLGL